MATTTLSPRENTVRRSSDAPSITPLDAAVWQEILRGMRAAHPTLHRVWFDQLVPRQLTNGVIQVLVSTPAQLNFCQGQCQKPFTNVAQAVTGRLIAVSFGGRGSG